MWGWKHKIEVQMKMCKNVKLSFTSLGLGAWIGAEGRQLKCKHCYTFTFCLAQCLAYLQNN